jgi:flagellar M-ring protein FliF
MNEQMKKALEPLSKFWEGTSSIVKKIIIGSFIGIIIIAIILSILLNSKDYVVIFEQLPDSESSEIIATLSEMNTEVRLDGAGNIMVLEEDESRVRMELATQGYPKNGLSYYLIEQGSGMLTTDYERKQYVNMQLQERIAASIRTLEGVKDAVVTITTPEEKAFYLQEKEVPTASVIIHMKPGSSLNQAQVLGIQNLIAKSVSGLTKENIALSDSQGNDLVGDLIGNNSGLNKLNITREIENDIRKKIYTVLEGPYSLSQLKISVTATVNIDPLVREETIYTPSPDGDNSGVIKEETRTEETSSSTQTDGGVPGTTSNAEIPIYPTGGSNGSGSSSSSSENIKYQVSEVKSQTQREGAVIEAISIGIAIDKPTFNPGERESVTELVAFAAGVAPENITVQNFEFYQDDADEPVFSDNLGGVRGIDPKYIYLGIAALIVLIIIGIIIYKIISRKRKEEQALDLRIGAEDGEGEALDSLFGEPEKEKVKQIVPLQDEKRKEIIDFAKENPEITAQMIKTWLKSEND